MKKILNPLDLIFTIIMLSFMIIFYFNNQYRFLYYTIIIYFIWICYIYFESQKIYEVKNYIKGLVLFTIFMDILGFSLHFYDKFYWFDDLLHIFGSFSFTLFYYALIKIYWGDFSSSNILNFILITSLGLASGVLYELGEFLFDLIFHSKNQNGLIDTNFDLIFDLFGSSLGSLWGIWRKRLILLKSIKSKK